MRQYNFALKFKNWLQLAEYFAVILNLVMTLVAINITAAYAQPWIYSYEADKQLAQEVKKSYEIQLDTPMESIIQELSVESKNAQLGRVSDEDARLTTVEMLGHVPDTKQIPILEKLLLDDPSNTVRAQCALSLQLLDSINSIPVLLKALSDSDEGVKLKSALALAFLGEKEASLSVLENLWNTGNAGMKLFCHLGFRDVATKAAIEDFRRALNDNDPFVAVDAAIMLAQLQYYSDAFPTLQKFLTHEDKYVRMSALRGLAYIGDQKSLDLVRSMLNDKELLTRKQSKEILSNYGESIPGDRNITGTVNTRYNPEAAVQYSENWWNKRNPVYPYYVGNDCANFASQCLIAGGLDLSKGTDGSGANVKQGGIISFCDYLHSHLVTYQDVRYERKSKPSEPDWIVKGDVAIFGDSSDRWRHAVFAVTDVVEYNAHTNDRWHKRASNFYSAWPSADFYHINNRICSTSNPNLLVGCYQEGSNGWHSDSHIFYEAYMATGGKQKVGMPDTSSGETPYVHYWRSDVSYEGNPLIQDFNGGDYGDCAIISSPDPAYAFLLRTAFWNTYKNLPAEGRDFCLGKPLNDEYQPSSGKSQGGSKVSAIQDFEYGHLEFYRTGCNNSGGCVDIYTKNIFESSCSSIFPSMLPQFSWYRPASPVCSAISGQNSLGCRNPLPNPTPNPGDSCGCDGNNPTLNCTITGAYSCTGRNSITLTPNFHAVQGSNVTLRP